MKQFTTTEQTTKLIALGFEKPSPNFYQNGVTWIQCEGNYSIGKLIKMLPSYVEWNGNYYYLQIKTKWTYSWTVSYDSLNNKAKIFPVYDGGSCLIDILYNVLINLVALKNEFTDIGGHDEYDQGEVLSQVFKLTK